MNTGIFYLDEVPLLVPFINDVPIEFPSLRMSEFASYCGAGKGIGDLIVPETVWGLNVSAACFIHDVSWDLADATWQDFHLSNSMFLHNILSINTIKGGAILRPLRNYRAITYYNAVDTIGASIFWGLKKTQKGAP